MLQKGPEKLKKFVFCQYGFDRNAPHLMTAVPCLLSTPVLSMRCKARTKADIH